MKALAASALVGILMVSCGREPAPEPFPADDHGLIVSEERIRAEAALGITGLRTQHEKDDGASRWSARLVRYASRRSGETVVYPFQLEVENRSADPLILDASLELVRDDGMVRRTRRLDQFVTAPWTLKRMRGIVRATEPHLRLVTNVQIPEGQQESE